MYELNLCQKITENCAMVNDYPKNINAGQNTNGGIVRYGLLLVIVDVVICSYLHSYNISSLQPFGSYSLSIRAVNDIGSTEFSEPYPIRLVNTSESNCFIITVCQ